MRFAGHGLSTGAANVAYDPVAHPSGLASIGGGRSVRLSSSIRFAATRTRADRGAVAVEYALLAALIAVVIIAAVVFLGTNLLGLFSETASSVGAA